MGQVTWCVPSLHPASLYRDQTMQFAVKADFAKLMRIVGDGGPTVVPPPWEEWQLFPTEDNVHFSFDDILNPKFEGWPWSIDFEATLDRRVVCLGIWPCFEPTKTRGICIPFLKQGGLRYWSPAEEQRVFDLCKRFFEDPSILKTGMNIAGYDTGVPPFNKRALLKQAWGIDIQGIDVDIQVAHALCWPELRHSLALQSSIVTDLPPWKMDVWDDEDEEEDKATKWARVLERPDREFRIYNLQDCFSQAVGRNVLVEIMA